MQTDGTLWCWGSSTAGQVGDGTMIERDTPVQVGSATAWATVSAGEDHTCATRPDATLWCWGSNTTGALGDGGTSSEAAPVPIQAATAWTIVGAGGSHTCAADTTGRDLVLGR